MSPDINEHGPSSEDRRQMNELPAMLTAKQVSRLLRIRLPQVYVLARDGVIPSVRVGRTVRFNRDRLFAWIDAGGRGLSDEEQE